MQRDAYRSGCGGTSKISDPGTLKVVAMQSQQPLFCYLSPAPDGERYFRCCGHWVQRCGYKFREWLGNIHHSVNSYSHWRPASGTPTKCLERMELLPTTSVLVFET